MKNIGVGNAFDFKRPLRMFLFASLTLILFPFIVKSECIVIPVNPQCSDELGSIKVYNTDTKAHNKKYVLYKHGNLESTVTSSSTYTFKDLLADFYEIKMYSQGSDSAWTLFCSKEVTIIAPDPILIAVNKIGPVNCTGGKNGFVNIDISGGSTPYSITWSNGSSNEDVGGLEKGKHIVFITDNKGCSAEKTFIITEPDSGMSLSLDPKNSDCTNKTGSVSLTVIGGTKPYDYTWSNGSASKDISGIGAGVYVAKVTDNNGCEVKDSVTLTAPPNAIELNATSKNITCNGGSDGSIDLEIKKGKAPLTILWSNGSTDSAISNLVAGTYSVRVTDSSNCFATKEIKVNQPTPLGVVKKETNVLCKSDDNGAIELTVAGGTYPYSFKWSHGPTSKDLKDLAPGAYSVTIKDSNNCSISVTSTITEPTQVLKATAVGNSLSCKGANSGSVDLTVTGGTTPYTFEWSNDATTEDLSNVSAGSYSVFVTDANDCIVAAKAKVTQPENAFVVRATVANISCKGKNDGSIEIIASGGKRAYSYIWDHSPTDSILTDLAVGLYTVRVTDANACTIAKQITVNEPASLFATYEMSIGCTGKDGKVDLSPSGGTEPYTFEWSNGSIVEDLKNLTPGVYKFSIADQRGCSFSDSLEIKEEAHKCINVPNGFTPNGDGQNDFWLLRNIESFPSCVVDVFDESGRTIFSSKGYEIPWDGSYAGGQVPLGTYFYVINLNNGDKQLSGTVSIIR